MASTQLTKTFTSYSTPYKLIVDLTATSTISSNSSTITAKISLYCPYALTIYGRSNSITINGTKYTFSSPAINTSGKTTHTLGTVTTGAIAHNTDGTKSVSVSCTFNIQATIGGTYYNSIVASGTFTLDKISRAATLTSAPNFTDEGNPVIKYSNPAGNAVTSLDACISFTGTNADVPYRAVSKTGTSYTFNLTDEERETLRNGTTDKTSRNVYFYLRTTMGGGTYYSKLAKTLTIVNCEPFITDASIYDYNETATALTGSNEIFIRGYSDARYTIEAEAKKNTTITEYKVVVGSKSYYGASGTVTDMEDGTVRYIVTDKRGLTASYSPKNYLVMEYFKPTCNLDVAMPTTEGNTSLTVNGNCFNDTFGAVKNTIDVEYRYKSDAGEYGDWIAATVEFTDNTYKATAEVTGLDYRSTYTFQARVVDKLNTIESVEIVVRTTPVFDWSKEDFNFNVPISMNGDQVLRYTDENKTVLSANGADIYLRPNGSTTDEGQLRLTTTGKLTVGGYTLPYITTGTATIKYGSAANSVSVNFGVTYATKPVVITSQVFNETNICVFTTDVTTTGFKATVAAGFTSSGSRQFNWIAIGAKA